MKEINELKEQLNYLEETLHFLQPVGNPSIIDQIEFENRLKEIKALKEKIITTSN
jgi:hypothetical protein